MSLKINTGVIISKNPEYWDQQLDQLQSIKLYDHQFIVFNSVDDALKELKTKKCPPPLILDYVLDQDWITPSLIKSLMKEIPDLLIVIYSHVMLSARQKNTFTNAGVFDFIEYEKGPDAVIIKSFYINYEWYRRFDKKQEPLDFYTAIKNGENEKMRKLAKSIEATAQVPTNTLITGETGTGKEVVAYAIYNLSNRKKTGKFIPVNCASIPDNLFESILFGHKKGSFTGATNDHEGLIVAADKGVLFLDEIGEMPQYMQSKLLRVIQDRKVRPIGSTKETNIDVKIICATNQNLQQLILSGGFRKDLYYRINVFTLLIPPLRERSNDIPRLVNEILNNLSRHFPQSAERVSEKVLYYLLRYNWPGNVRELQNSLEYALNMCKGSVITPEHLSDTILQYKPNKTLYDILIADHQSAMSLTQGKLERENIVEALRRTNWNKSEAAKQLNISRMTLYRKITDYGISTKKPK